jgi:site-specific DNA-methyltransferase (adenine-specific)
VNGLPRNTILVGDALDHLHRLPASSVDCVITSPPYFALRNYQVAGQIGLEASVHDWVAHLVAVVDEIARVLKPEGSLWLNLGDSYSRHDRFGAPPKSFLLAPERLLLALAERGWIVRNKVVWAKPNPMPASVTDRLTASWEPMYFLVRSRRYFFDLDAIRVPHRSRLRRSGRRRGPKPRRPNSGRPAAWAGPLAGDQSGLDRLKASGVPGHPLGKNPADVWMMAKSSFRGGHHATFPEALVERPLLATCPERVCAACGQAWRRQRLLTSLGSLAVRGELRPTCGCRAGWQPGLALDPFLGSGTTAVVAERLGRNWLGVELSPDFAAVAEDRIATARTASKGRGT